MREHYKQLAPAIVEFSRYLRTQGFSADLRQTMTALEAAQAINITNPRDLLPTLKTTLCSTPEEWEQFPNLFHAFWGETAPGARSASTGQKRPPKDDSGTRREDSSVFLHSTGNQNPVQEGTAKAVHGASALERLRKVDFSELPSEDLPQLEEISLRLMRRMSQRLSRKLVNSNRADRIDLRRTIRRSIALGGEPLVLAYKSRKTRKNKLVILLDVSGSMNFYSLFFLRFAYALQTHFQHVHTFLFSTNIVEISDLLRTRRLADSLRRLSHRPAGWSGGTKIGESLQHFNQRHGKKLLTRDTIFIILSDGWDTGEPDLLASQLRFAKRSVHKVLWLNPLLGLKDYQPITRGMAAALPFIDVFSPAHNLQSLLALERHL
jgi:uncharacterized protein